MRVLSAASGEIGFKLLNSSLELLQSPTTLGSTQILRLPVELVPQSAASDLVNILPQFRPVARGNQNEGCKGRISILAASESGANASPPKFKSTQSAYFGE